MRLQSLVVRSGVQLLLVAAFIVNLSLRNNASFDCV
jgi:hypothetical protein